MPSKPSPPPESLRAMLAQALQAYELAQATRLQAERTAQAEHRERLRELQERKQAETQQLAAEHRREAAAAGAEQERVGHLYGEKKQPVELDEFYISRTPITNAQYQVFVQPTGHAAPSHWTGGRPPKGKEQHPVVNVSNG